MFNPNWGDLARILTALLASYGVAGAGRADATTQNGYRGIADALHDCIVAAGGDSVTYEASPRGVIKALQDLAAVIASGSVYGDEQARDAIAAALTDSSSINLAADDGANTITASAIFGSTAGTVAEGNHTHSAATITDFAEAVDDRVGSLLVAGSNVTLTYNDAGNALTIASPGGGGAAAWGGITGTLGDQADLASALGGKLASTTRLDQITAPTASVSLNNQKITNLLDPVAAQDGATKAYVDLPLSENPQTGTTYTLALTDTYNKDRKYVSLSNAAAITLTVPPNSSVAFPVGTEIVLKWKGVGQPTVAAGSGVVVESSGNKFKLNAQHSFAFLLQTAADVWSLSGDTAA